MCDSHAVQTCEKHRELLTTTTNHPQIPSIIMAQKEYHFAVETGYVEITDEIRAKIMNIQVLTNDFTDKDGNPLKRVKVTFNHGVTKYYSIDKASNTGLIEMKTITRRGVTQEFETINPQYLREFVDKERISDDGELMSWSEVYFS